MCGIVGIAGRNLNFDVYKTVFDMAQEVSHRGPDSGDIWSDSEKNVVIAHRRLAIVDLTDLGGQPMASHCGRFLLSFNGEIYNFEELRQMLPSQSWNGGSDTEVFLSAIAEWGLEKALTCAQGMFAFSLYDKNKKIMYLARDRFGEKPLFFSRKGGYLSFASDLSAFKHLNWFNHDIDNVALSHYFQFGFTGQEESIYRHISKLKSGSIMSFDIARGEVNIQTYYDSTRLDDHEEHGKLPTYENVVGHIQSMLTETVKRQMRVDANFGAFLSGGIDSSLIVALMQQNSDSKINTFSIGNEDLAFDESKSARQTSSLLGTNHSELMLTNKGISNEILNITRYMDEPFADSSFIPTFLLSRFAKKNVKVCLTGDAGDEVFSGYNRYKWFQSKHNFDKRFVSYIVNPVLSCSFLLSDKSLAKIYNVIRGGLPSFARVNFPEDKFKKIRKIHSAETANDVYYSLLSDDVAEKLIIDFKHTEKFDFCVASSFVKQLILLDQNFYMPLDILKKVDTATMASGLEARIPYLDHNIVRYCQKLPMEYLMEGGRPKSILRDILSNYLPQNFIERPKIGFGIPISSILKTTLRSFVEELFLKELKKENQLINVEYIYQIWNSFLDGDSKFDEQIWRSVIFFSWIEKQKEGS